MSNELQKNEQVSIEIWDNKRQDKIRKLFAPDLSNDEFHFFWGLGKSLGANPFTREIWAIKYDKKGPAQVFLGRDFHRKKAQEQPDYNGHIVDAVYENDDFRVVDGKPAHSYKLKDRGALLGAYCIVYKKGQDIPFYVFCELAEYNKNQSAWKDKPATMIKKVAEAQGLRGAYQGIFKGTYDEAEAWTDTPEQPVDRQPLDFDDAEEVHDDEKQKAQPDTLDTDSDDQPMREQYMHDTTQQAQQAFGDNWHKELKKHINGINPEADNMLQLSDKELIKLNGEITELAKAGAEA